MTWIAYHYSPWMVNYTAFAFVLFTFIVAMPLHGIGFAFFAKDGVFMDCLISKPFSLKDYVQIKILVLILYGIINYIVFIPFFFIHYSQIRLVLLGIVIYNLGVGVPVLLHLCSFDVVRVDLNRGSVANHEGNSVTKTLLIIPVFFPLLFFDNLYDIGLALMYLTGGAGLLFMNKWVELIEKNLIKRKYLRLEGFRK